MGSHSRSDRRRFLMGGTGLAGLVIGAVRSVRGQTPAPEARPRDLFPGMQRKQPASARSEWRVSPAGTWTNELLPLILESRSPVRHITPAARNPPRAESFFDDRAVRRAAMMYQVPCITTLIGAVSAIRALREQGLGVRALQDRA